MGSFWLQPSTETPVQCRTIASPTVLGLLKITSGEGFYRQQAGGTGERREIGCLCVLPDEGMLDVDSSILPASLCHGCVQSEGELYI